MHAERDPLIYKSISSTSYIFSSTSYIFSAIPEPTVEEDAWAERYLQGQWSQQKLGLQMEQ